MLSESRVAAGYSGLRDSLTPIYYNFFVESTLFDDNTRKELKTQMMEQLVMISCNLMQEDRVDKLLPMMLELLKDDSEEERRILGLEMLDLLSASFGPEVCQNYLIYEIVSLQDDPVYKVRKETVKHIVGIAKVVSAEVF